MAAGQRHVRRSSMLKNTKLQDFVAAVSAKGQIGYGDVRRLQRDILPAGIFSRDEAELLIALNAQLFRGDKAWGPWLVAAVVEFAANQEGGEHPLGEALGEWLGRLVASSTTLFGRSVARKIRRALGPHHDAQSTDAAMPDPEPPARCGRARPRQVREPKAKRDKRSPRRSKPRCAARPEVMRDATPLAAAGPGWSLPGYWSAIRHSHLMNFPSAPAGLVLAPCR